MPKKITTRSRKVTDRFLEAIDKLISNRSTGKLTQEKIGKEIGMASANITRLRKDESKIVPLEACCRLCESYKVSATWLLLGVDEENTSADKTLEKRVTKLESVLKQVLETKN